MPRGGGRVSWSGTLTPTDEHRLTFGLWEVCSSFTVTEIFSKLGMCYIISMKI
jgi:hypothetical protein